MSQGVPIALLSNFMRNPKLRAETTVLSRLRSSRRILVCLPPTGAEMVEWCSSRLMEQRLIMSELPFIRTLSLTNWGQRRSKDPSIVLHAHNTKALSLPCYINIFLKRTRNSRKTGRKSWSSPRRYKTSLWLVIYQSERKLSIVHMKYTAS